MSQETPPDFTVAVHSVKDGTVKVTNLWHAYRLASVDDLARTLGLERPKALPMPDGLRGFTATGFDGYRRIVTYL